MVAYPDPRWDPSTFLRKIGVMMELPQPHPGQHGSTWAPGASLHPPLPSEDTCAADPTNAKTPFASNTCS